MEETLKFASIFRKRPEKWGLRGDPFLWELMEWKLKEVPLPNSVGEVKERITNEFAQITNVTYAGRIVNWELFEAQKWHYLVGPEGIVQERYLTFLPSRGMSGGTIHVGTWRNKLLPLLLENAKTLLE